jgi:hypothetical protein
MKGWAYTEVRVGRLRGTRPAPLRLVLMQLGMDPQVTDRDLSALRRLSIRKGKDIQVDGLQRRDMDAELRRFRSGCICLPHRLRSPRRYKNQNPEQEL